MAVDDDEQNRVDDSYFRSSDGHIWGFPERGVALNHAFSIGFCIVNHPAIGVSPWKSAEKVSPFLDTLINGQMA